MSGIKLILFVYLDELGFLTHPLPKLSQMSSLYLLPELETHINTFNAWALSSYVKVQRKSVYSSPFRQAVTRMY